MGRRSSWRSEALAFSRELDELVLAAGALQVAGRYDGDEECCAGNCLTDLRSPLVAPFQPMGSMAVEEADECFAAVPLERVIDLVLEPPNLAVTTVVV
jgi:hypothetical protein